MNEIVLSISLLLGTPAVPAGTQNGPVPQAVSDEALSGMTTDQLIENAQEALLQSKDATARAVLAMLRNRGESIDPRLTFNEAVTAYRMGDYEQARALFQAASELAQAQDNNEKIKRE